MYQLMYISDKTDSLKKNDLSMILASARKNNELFSVTGLLLDITEHFIQILEGEQKDVESTFNKICNDNRHCNVRRIYSENILTREFGTWSMGFSADLDETVVKDTIHIANAFAKKQQFNDMQTDSLRLLLKSLIASPNN